MQNSISSVHWYWERKFDVYDVLMIFICPPVILYRRLSNKALLFSFFVSLIVASSFWGLIINGMPPNTAMVLLPIITNVYFAGGALWYGIYRLSTRKRDRTSIGTGVEVYRDYLGLTPREFENFVGYVFKSKGYIVESINHTKDQGADIVMSRRDEKVCVQVKRYGGSVGNKAVQEVVASLPYYNADRGIVVTTGRFTEAAKTLASVNEVELIDGTQFSKLVRETVGNEAIESWDFQ